MLELKESLLSNKPFYPRTALERNLATYVFTPPTRAERLARWGEVYHWLSEIADNIQFYLRHALPRCSYVNVLEAGELLSAYLPEIARERRLRLFAKDADVARKVRSMNVGLTNIPDVTLAEPVALTREGVLFRSPLTCPTNVMVCAPLLSFQQTASPYHHIWLSSTARLVSELGVHRWEHVWHEGEQAYPWLFNSF